MKLILDRPFFMLGGKSQLDHINFPFELDPYLQCVFVQYMGKSYMIPFVHILAVQTEDNEQLPVMVHGRDDNAPEED